MVSERCFLFSGYRGFPANIPLPSSSSSAHCQKRVTAVTHRPSSTRIHQHSRSLDPRRSNPLGIHQHHRPPLPQRRDNNVTQIRSLPPAPRSERCQAPLAASLPSTTAARCLHSRSLDPPAQPLARSTSTAARSIHQHSCSLDRRWFDPRRRCCCLSFAAAAAAFLRSPPCTLQTTPSTPLRCSCCSALHIESALHTAALLCCCSRRPSSFGAAQPRRFFFSSELSPIFLLPCEPEAAVTFKPTRAKIVLVEMWKQRCGYQFQ
ncbi:hypothetical protein ACOSQ2_026041 [Xanthoceras sorbifolium]